MFVAAADADEARYRDCAGLLAAHRGRLVTTSPALAETAWLIEDRLGPTAEARFLTLAATGALTVIDLTIDDYQRCIELITTYADLGLGVVDVSLVAIAERHGNPPHATLNHRDFRVVRPTHPAAFELLP